MLQHFQDKAREERSWSGELEQQVKLHNWHNSTEVGDLQEPFCCSGVKCNLPFISAVQSHNLNSCCSVNADTVNPDGIMSFNHSWPLEAAELQELDNESPSCTASGHKASPENLPWSPGTCSAGEQGEQPHLLSRAWSSYTSTDLLRS